MASIDDYLAYVSPEVEGCPRGLMVRDLTAAMIKFCRKSYYVNKEVPFTLVDGDSKYAFPSDDDWSLISVIEAKYKGKEIPLKSREWLNENWPGWAEAKGGTPLVAYLESLDEINVYPTPDQSISGDLDVLMVVQPKRSSLVWVDEVDENYVEHIAHGAKASLMMMKGRQWYDPNQAAYCASMFKEGYLEAKREVMKSFSDQSLFVSAPKLGA